MLFDRLKEAKKNLGLEEKLLEDPDGNVGEEVVIGQDYIDETDEVPGENFEDPHKDYKVCNNGLEGDEDIVVPEDSEEVIEKEFNDGLLCSDDPLCNVEMGCKASNEYRNINQEIVDFYKNHSELEGRLYPNGQLNPALSMENYHLDRAWLCNNLSLEDHNKFEAQDSLFKQSYKAKIEEWDKEYKQYMNNACSHLYTQLDSMDEFDVADTKAIIKKIKDECNIPTIEQKEESMDALHKEEDTSGNTKSNVDTFLEKYTEGNDIIQVLRKDLMSILSDVQWIIESGNQNEQFALDFADAINELSVRI